MARCHIHAQYAHVHGRHRRSGRSAAVPLAAAGVVVLLLGAGALVNWASARRPAGSGCDDGPSITVAAAPEIAPAVQAEAARLNSAGMCVTYTVSSVDPADIAALLAESVGATLTGLGRPNGTVRAPDIWIPDSSIWLQRLAALNPGLVPSSAEPVAQSPLVLAMPEPVARGLGWPGQQPSWATVLATLTHGNGVRPGIVDPARDVTGLSGLLALRAAVAAQPGGSDQVTLGGMHTLALGRCTVRAELLSQFPRASDARTLAQALAVAPLPEQSVIAYDAAEPPVPVIALPFGDTASALDYPLAVLPGARTGINTPAQQLRAALAGPAYQHRLALAGLRGSDGSAGPGFATPPGTPSSSPSRPPPVDPAAVNQTLALWAQVSTG
jgi:Ca-activated chloride channel family protein